MSGASDPMPAGMYLPRPGAALGSYPERNWSTPGVWLSLVDALGNCLSLGTFRRHRARQAFPATLKHALAEQESSVLSVSEQAGAASRRLKKEGFTTSAVAQAFALIDRVIEMQQGRRPYLTQHQAAYALLRDKLVEMGTGEGKSLAMLMAAGTAALARVPVHVFTSNDYLAARDMNTAKPVLNALGLTCMAVSPDMTPAQRRQAYLCDVVYTTARETGFDYLRDRLSAVRNEASGAIGAPVLRGLCFALIDEADNVLLDHARAPLVLAQEAAHALDTDTAVTAFAFAAKLQQGADYHIDLQNKAVELNPEVAPRFLDVLHAGTNAAGGSPDSRVVAELLRDALVALQALKRDVHYVLRDNEVVLIDSTTGRALPGTVWSKGLHRMVCIKEGTVPPAATQTALQITLHDLFGRYCKVGGISGTLTEARFELWFFYRLGVQCIAPRAASRRVDLGTRLYRNRAAQFAAVTDRVRSLKAARRAVLVGTDSVAAAEALSQHLQSHGIEHRLLTARNDAQEASLIAEAGLPGAVTVATNMAGRGTDITLDVATRDAGGLHVICCTQNVSRRVDRQLYGRAARNGQPGSFESMLALDDPALALALPGLVCHLATRGERPDKAMSPVAERVLCGWARASSVWTHLVRCMELAQREKYLKESLVYAPRAE